MALNFSKAELTRARDRVQSLQNRVKAVQKKAEATAIKMIRTAEVGGAAFGMGVIQGKTGGVEVMGVPLDLGLGVGLNVAGYFGLAGKASDHVNAVGDGCLAAYLTTVGRGVGAAWTEKDAQKQVEGKETKKVSGESLTADEIRQVMRQREAAMAG